MLRGEHVTLREMVAGDIPELVRIRQTPEVLDRWLGGPDLAAELGDDLSDEDLHVLTIEHEGRIIGAIQWAEETDPLYRHANMDIYLDPATHGRGLGTDAVRTLARELVGVHGFHRIVIDPAADNFAAIRAYQKVGFKPVGVMRRYELGADGAWHDGLLMDLLAEEL